MFSRFQHIRCLSLASVENLQLQFHNSIFVSLPRNRNVLVVLIETSLITKDILIVLCWFQEAYKHICNYVYGKLMRTMYLIIDGMVETKYRHNGFKITLLQFDWGTKAGIYHWFEVFRRIRYWGCSGRLKGKYKGLGHSFSIIFAV